MNYLILMLMGRGIWVIKSNHAWILEIWGVNGKSFKCLMKLTCVAAEVSGWVQWRVVLDHLNLLLCFAFLVVCVRTLVVTPDISSFFFVYINTINYICKLSLNVNDSYTFGDPILWFAFVRISSKESRRGRSGLGIRVCDNLSSPPLMSFYNHQMRIISFNYSWTFQLTI